MQAATINRPFDWAWLKRFEVIALVLGLSVLLVPTYARLEGSLWNQEAYEHGPIIIAVFWWLLWRSRTSLAAVAVRPQPLLGGLCFAAGLFLYFVGRSQSLPLFEVASHIPILAGLLLALAGGAAVRVLWFPLFLLLFLIPLPGFVIVGITSELKQHVSAVAEMLLYHVGYPIARDGVVITVGQYRMLVADACSGLNSMYALAAMGLLYMYLVRRQGWLHNGVLLAAIVPFAFAANVLRVIVLILLTFHFGDAAGQGFMHGVSGILLFVVALLLLMGLDAVLSKVLPRRSAAQSATQGAEHAQAEHAQ